MEIVESIVYLGRQLKDRNTCDTKTRGRIAAVGDVINRFNDSSIDTGTRC